MEVKSNVCLAIVKPKDAIIPIEYLQQGWIANPNGGGYAFVHEGSVIIRKGYMKLRDWLAAYNTDLHANLDSPFLIHFRITSLGESSEKYTHPFAVAGGALIHNGTMSGTGAKYGEGPSDTAIFTERYARHLTFDIIQANRPDWDDALRGNKVATLYNDGRYQIINEQDGKWEDGVWYSNTSHKSYWSSNHATGSSDWE